MFFSESGTWNWSYKLYAVTKTDKDTLPIYQINNLPQKNREAFIKCTELKWKENETVTVFFRSNCLCPSLIIDITLLLNKRSHAFSCTGAETAGEILMFVLMFEGQQILVENAYQKEKKTLRSVVCLIIPISVKIFLRV